MGPFVEAPVVQIDYLHVRPAFHRRGVGRALVAAAAAFCDEIGAEHVVVNVFPQVREANRFYAKLGFSPLVVRRVAPVSSTLRRTLGLRRRRAQSARRRAGPAVRAGRPHQGARAHPRLTTVAAVADAA